MSAGRGGLGDRSVGRRDGRRGEVHRDGRRRGTSLVEILVALSVLEVGLLGVVGLLVDASRTLGRATLLERSVTLAGNVADSLLGLSDPGSGELRTDSLLVRWDPRPGGIRLTVRSDVPGATPVLDFLVPHRGAP